MLTYVTPAVVSLAALGALPRAGPGRALRLGLSTWLPVFQRSIVKSQRNIEVTSLKNKLKAQQRDQYIVVFGEKGVGEWAFFLLSSTHTGHVRLTVTFFFLVSSIAGKSTIIDNALEDEFGVMFVDVAPAATHDDIVIDVMKKVTRYNSSLLDVHSGAARVIRWHTAIFRTPPTVVLRVHERPINNKHASVGSAVRVLVEHGLRVVIDSSDDSLPSPGATSLQQLVYVGPMEYTVLASVPELKGLLAVLNGTGNDRVVFAVLGGVPASYFLLLAAWEQAGMPTDEAAVTQLVDSTLKGVLAEANSNLIYMRGTHPAFKEVYSRFKDVDQLPDSILDELGLVQPSPDRVLRQVERPDADGKVLVPATAAMLHVLRYGKGGKPPTVLQLRQLLSLEAQQDGEMK